jgi:ditrans,polycis-polyprenyl diphosphate synthase
MPCLVEGRATTSGRPVEPDGVLSGCLRWLEQLARRWITDCLLQGPQPRHIAFVMDGNRRFASRTKQLTIEGHRFGYYKVAARCSSKT